MFRVSAATRLVLALYLLTRTVEYWGRMQAKWKALVCGSVRRGVGVGDRARAGCAGDEGLVPREEAVVTLYSPHGCRLLVGHPVHLLADGASSVGHGL